MLRTFAIQLGLVMNNLEDDFMEMKTRMNDFSTPNRVNPITKLYRN